MEKTAQELKNEYQKEWRKKNKAKIKKYNINYWKKKATKEKEADK